MTHHASHCMPLATVSPPSFDRIYPFVFSVDGLLTQRVGNCVRDMRWFEIAMTKRLQDDVGRGQIAGIAVHRALLADSPPLMQFEKTLFVYELSESVNTHTHTQLSSPTPNVEKLRREKSRRTFVQFSAPFCDSLPTPSTKRARRLDSAVM